jgi:hypothetical protein
VDVEASPGAELAEGVPETVPRGMRGLADPRDPVDLLQSDDPPRGVPAPTVRLSPGPGWAR